MVLYHFKYGSVGIIFYYFKDIINYFKVISINWKIIDEKTDYLVGKYLLKKSFFSGKEKSFPEIQVFLIHSY